jgi:hypothetical protein
MGVFQRIQPVSHENVFRKEAFFVLVCTYLDVMSLAHEQLVLGDELCPAREPAQSLS